jgi:hypothetical protein
VPQVDGKLTLRQPSSGPPGRPGDIGYSAAGGTAAYWSVALSRTGIVKDAASTQKLGQPQPFIAVFPQECTYQLALFGLA